MILALSGGVGGAKLVQGLAAHVPADTLAIVVNTGDDIDHFGLHISPDVDTVMYTLAGLASLDRGWGLQGETWSAMGMFERYGAETWFNLGDQDLATNILRTEALRQGHPLSIVTDELRRRLGLAVRIIPMTDDPVTTYVDTPIGKLHFQEYFVRERCTPEVLGIEFRGLSEAHPSPPLQKALAEADAIIVTPSNPIVSVGPILGVPGVRDALRQSRARRIAVTPLIQGQAVKGPTVPMMHWAGLEPNAVSVARLYSDFLDTFILDERDAALRPDIEALGLRVHVADTLMTTAQDKARLAHEILDLL